MMGRPKFVTTNVRERAQSLLSPLNLHLAGVALLGLINLYLLVHMGFLWQQAKGQDAEAVATQEVALKTAKIQAAPLEGLDKKLELAGVGADGFLVSRIPVSDSEVATELGALAKKENLRLTRVQYGHQPLAADGAALKPGTAGVALSGPGTLTETRIDASLTGGYRPLVQFLNGLERDKLFFLISGITLSGQQGGAVNLRVKVTTYERGITSDEETQRVSIGSAAEPAAATVPPVGGTL